MGKPETCPKYGTSQCCGFRAKQWGIETSEKVKKQKLTLKKVEGRGEVTLQIETEAPEIGEATDGWFVTVHTRGEIVRIARDQRLRAEYVPWSQNLIKEAALPMAMKVDKPDGCPLRGTC